MAKFVFAEQTIREKFETIAEMLDPVKDAEMIAFLKDRAAKSIRKSSDKPSKIQTEMTDVIMPLVLEALGECDNPITVGDLIKTPKLADFVTAEGKNLSSSKVTSALRKLGDRVVNVKEGKKSLYKVV